MARKTEKTDDIAPNPLMESGVEKMIQIVRGKQVLLDRDIATLYGVETRAINQAVKRNIERFPERYCFRLEKNEQENLKSQNVIPRMYPSQSWMHLSPCGSIYIKMAESSIAFLMSKQRIWNRTHVF